MRASHSGDDNVPLPTRTASETEEMLVRDENPNEVYMPLFSSIKQKPKRERLFVLLDFENGVTIDDLLNSTAYVSAIPHIKFDRFQKQARPKFSESMTLQTFRYK